MASANIWMQSLKWINHKNSIVDILSNVRSRDAFCDASISCDGKFFSVHKLVMSACSDYLRGLFEQVSQYSSNTTHPVIILHDIRHKHLQHLLDLIYLGTVDVPQSEVPHLIKVANCLQFKGLGVTNDFPPANITNSDSILEETNDNELNQCEVISNEFLGDDCFDPLALDSLVASATTSRSQEHLTAPPLQSIQHQRTESPSHRELRGGRKWQPGGRGRPPKNVKYVKETQNKLKNSYDDLPIANNSRWSTEENEYLHVEESSFNTREEEFQYTGIRSIDCPICQQKFPLNEIESHASSCDLPNLRSSIVPTNKSDEFLKNVKPLKMRIKAHENLKNEIFKSIPRKKRRKRFLFNPKYLKRKYTNSYSTGKAYFNKSPKIDEKNITEGKDKSKLTDNEIKEIRNLESKKERLTMTNAVIPKVKRRGRPPKIKKIETRDKKEETYFNEVSSSSNLVGKDPHHLATPRTAIYSNYLEKNKSNIEHVSDSTVSLNSLFPDFEWNESPGPSGIQRTIKVEKDDTYDWQSNLWSQEQFDDVTIKIEEPAEDMMFRIESVRSIQNHPEESRDRNNGNNNNESVHTDDDCDLIDEDMASNDEHEKSPPGCKNINASDTAACSFCSKQFFGKNCRTIRSRHERGQHTRKLMGSRYSCSSCDFSAYWLWEIEAHKKKKHTNMFTKKLKVFQKGVKIAPLKSSINESDKNKNILKGPKHVSSENETTSFKKSKMSSNASVSCHYCEKEFSGAYRYSVLKNHLKIHEGQREKCPHCSHTSVFKGNIYVHIRNKHKDILENHPEYKSLSKILTTTAHIKRKSVPSLSCSTCGKEFHGPHKDANLKRHNYFHKRKRLICPHCSYHCYRKPSLDMHIKKQHPNSIPFQEIKFPQIKLKRLPEGFLYTKEQEKNPEHPNEKSSLKKEYITQTDEETLKRLTAMSARDAWIKSENGKCLLCCRISKNFHYFKPHWRTHTGEKPYSCPYCPYRSSFTSNLKWHVNRYHLTANKVHKN
ncbi:unnamed protein product [Meganyctiphanes norvegica]|uniref:Uncharacterized protein n=1 Tax=Meganyctiphanes norvegica TaxID=48144 RepID=A0AAV2Q2M2_MEGNR